MTKFKIGDVVEITENPNGMAGCVFTIRTNESTWDGIQSWSGPAIGRWTNSWRWRETHLKLFDPVADAKALLEKEGYTITPPRPKMTGKAVVWTFKEQVMGSPFISSFQNYMSGEDKVILAIVDWTEGDGL